MIYLDILQMNLPGGNTDWGIEEKQTIIGSIFTEKLQFDGKKVRTAFFNEALFHFLSIDKGCSIIKKGQLNKNIKLSYKAPLVGSSSNRFWKDLKNKNLLISSNARSTIYYAVNLSDTFIEDLENHCNF